VSSELLKSKIIDYTPRIREALSSSGSSPEIATKLALLRQLWTNFCDIQYATENTRRNLLLWACRNSLELLAWTRYVSQSGANLKRFYDDVVFGETEEFHLLFSSDKNSRDEEKRRGYSEATDKVKKQKLSLGYSLAEPPLNIEQVAKQVGLEREFAAWYRALSRGGHETAFFILDRGLRDREPLLEMVAIVCIAWTFDAICTLARGCKAAERIIETAR
jgi:hypothetical protein